MKKFLLFTSPIWIALEFLHIKGIFWLLSQPSDIELLFGLFFISVSAFIHYLIINKLTATK